MDVLYITVEPLYDEVLGLTNYFFYSSNSKILGNIKKTLI